MSQDRVPNTTPDPAIQCRWSATGIALLLLALRAGMRAQSIGRHPLPELARMILHRGVNAPRASRQDVRCAVLRAARLLRLLRLRGNCVVRTLMALALLRGQQGLQVHVGFRPGDATEPDGHAWLTVHGQQLIADDAAGFAVTRSIVVEEKEPWIR